IGISDSSVQARPQATGGSSVADATSPKSVEHQIRFIKALIRCRAILSRIRIAAQQSSGRQPGLTLEERLTRSLKKEKPTRILRQSRKVLHSQAARRK